MDEEETEGWQEYWFVCGGVSELAKQAIESVDGRVQRVTHVRGFSVPPLYAVCLLYEDGDDDQGFCWYSDDGEKARKLFIRSADEWHDLYIYCADGSVPRFASDTTQLRIVTEAEWFALADAQK
jgi:hypothetical protein